MRERDLPPFAAAIAAGVAAVMPGHLRVAGLTGDRPATQSAAALDGLLRGELGFTGVIISDALEMRAVSDQGGVPSAAVRAVAAGVDLLCLGRDQDEEDYLAVRAALAAAVTGGELPAARLEEAAARVAQLRAALAAGALPGTPDGAPGPGAVPGGAPGAAAVLAGAPGPAAVPGGVPGAAAVPGNGDGIGLVAARRALRVSGSPGMLTDPLVFEVAPLGNIAVGVVPWGLAPWLPAGSVVQVPAGGERPAGRWRGPSARPRAAR